MNTNRLALFAAVSLAIGGLLGLAGTFSRPAIRGVAWGLDGTALVMGALLLAVHHIKLGNEQLAAGFFTFAACGLPVMGNVERPLSLLAAVSCGSDRDCEIMTATGRIAGRVASGVVRPHIQQPPPSPPVP